MVSACWAASAFAHTTPFVRVVACVLVSADVFALVLRFVRAVAFAPPASVALL